MSLLPTLKYLSSKTSSQALSITSSTFDAAIIVANSNSLNNINNKDLLPFFSSIERIAKTDASVQKSPVSLMFNENAPGSRLIFAKTGSILTDTADARVFFDLGKQAVARSLAAGSSKPLFYFHETSPKNRKGDPHQDFKHYLESFLLGVFQQMYEPLQAREHHAKLNQGKMYNYPITEIGVILNGYDEEKQAQMEALLKHVLAVEEGKIIARDMGGSDPERMSPLNCAKYIQEAFQSCSNVKISIEKDPSVLAKEYPLLHAVARCSLAVPRHYPCVVKIEYKCTGTAQENLFLVGKGVTYDTGGADIKAGGVMRGMSRDKCGATACAGFMKTLSLLAPKNVNATAYLGFVRNSVGADAYVSDEIIYSRAGVRCLVGNTDAEGRMVMTDLLCKSKEEALSIEGSSLDGNAPARIFTVATLTGHAVRAVGPYACCLDNGPSREAGIAQKIAKAGLFFSDPIEITTLRREDYGFIAPGSSTEDVIQANDKASSATSRGHQFPMAFMAVGSGLTKYGLDSEHPLCYTHLDIAGSAEESGSVGLSLPKATGAPIAALAGAFLL